MILVGNQRGGGRDLARHLMKTENERVEVAELRGFVANDLDGAFQESHAISRGTQCKQYLFSLSLNPPKGTTVSDEDFERAVAKAETKLGLTGQPRALVYHEKRGDDGEVRRHAHAVWSRIDVDEMKAVPLPHSHRKLQDVSRDLYLEHGWPMPRGLAVTGERDPRNFTLEQWQQAKRAGVNPREVKTAFQDAWAVSDSKAALTHALQERGYRLARGNRRGYVAVDHHGEVYVVAKWADVKTKAVRERLGDTETLPSVAEAKIEIARAMQAKMEAFQREVAEREAREEREAAARKAAIKTEQKAQRDAQHEAAQRRTREEERARQARLRTGLLGLWDRLRGERKRQLERNQTEAAVAQQRDLSERQQLTATQLAQRREMTKERTTQQAFNAATTKELTQDRAAFQRMEMDAEAERKVRREAFKERRRTEDRPRRRGRSRDGPTPGR